jgi:hypothetical protein
LGERELELIARSSTSPLHSSYIPALSRNIGCFFLDEFTEFRRDARRRPPG